MSYSPILLPSGLSADRLKVALVTGGGADSTPSLGQTTMASSLPVAIASNQTAIPVSNGNYSDSLPATQNITAQDAGSTTVTTNANNQPVTTGTPTAGSVAAFSLSGYGSARVQVTGTWTGTLISQISLDGGTTWYNQGIHESGTSYTVGSFTANFAGHTNASGVTNWRLQSTTTWTGTATVKVVASINPSSVYLANNIKITDGTVPSVSATIKPASTAPTATDSSIVVTESPNSPAATSALQTTGNSSLSTIVTNTGNASTSANQTNGNQQVKITNGTTVADTLTGDTGQNSQVHVGARKEVSFTTTTVQAVASTDVSNYKSISVHVVTQGTSSVVNWQISNDNTNWRPFDLERSDAASGQITPATSTSSASQIWYGNLMGARYFRLNVTGISAGTTAGVVEFSAHPVSYAAVTVGSAVVNLNSIAGTGTSAGVGVSNAGTLRITESNSATSTVTSVTAAASTTSLLASNTSRRMALFYNDSSAILYIKFGATASTTSYTTQVPANSLFELPAPVWNGAIDGIWASATGAVRITEIA